MKNFFSILAAVVLFSLSSYGFAKAVQRADRMCTSTSVNSEQYHDCLGI